MGLSIMALSDNEFCSRETLLLAGLLMIFVQCNDYDTSHYRKTNLKFLLSLSKMINRQAPSPI